MRILVRDQLGDMLGQIQAVLAKLRAVPVI